RECPRRGRHGRGALAGRGDSSPFDSSADPWDWTHTRRVVAAHHQPGKCSSSRRPSGTGEPASRPRTESRTPPTPPTAPAGLADVARLASPAGDYRLPEDSGRAPAFLGAVGGCVRMRRETWTGLSWSGPGNRRGTSGQERYVEPNLRARL